jgi:hypothetical protein
VKFLILSISDPGSSHQLRGDPYAAMRFGNRDEKKQAHGYFIYADQLSCTAAAIWRDLIRFLMIQLNL